MTTICYTYYDNGPAFSTKFWGERKLPAHAHNLLAHRKLGILGVKGDLELTSIAHS